MIKIYRASELAREEILKRNNLPDLKKAEAAASEIIADVRSRGDDALRFYNRKFDGCETAELRVSEEEVEAAYREVGEYFLQTLAEAAANIREFHERQRREGFSYTRPDGTRLGQRIMPLARVGVYVPGGTAAYPSTVLMDVIPAVVAGVGEIAMVTPPGKDGKIKAEILAAAKIAGVGEIYRVGGAQAVAALAYGTGSIRRVDKIVGPGNAFVATAKKAVSGEVGIDMFAGPSEILIIADGTANPDHLAADMLSQAEHDKMASAVLVTTSATVAERTAELIEKRLADLPRQETARASIENNGKIIVASSLVEAAEISDELAPEHLEIVTLDPESVLDIVKNAGSVFLGDYSPEPVGDYFAGPNHTLPTSGTARFSSPLGVDDFVKRSSYIKYSREALERNGARIADFAEREGLSAHARSVTARTEAKK